MNLRITLVVFLLITTAIKAQIGKNEVLHFIGGNVYGLVGAGLADQISDGNRYWTFAGAVTGSALIGVGKKVLHSKPTVTGEGFSDRDLWITILGGATVGVTIDIFTKHDGAKKVKSGRHAFFKRRALKDHLKFGQDGPPSLTQLSNPSSLYYQEVGL